MYAISLERVLLVYGCNGLVTLAKECLLALERHPETFKVSGAGHIHTHTLWMPDSRYVRMIQNCHRVRTNFAARD
jgi:hypothetical protein